ncbi:MAG: NAD(P)/FAD-dependent oxidoreductase [Sphingobacteriaceae bacterium]|nr:NAD(P)/FAD-dependent oxidoreductase [Sphingobacteriaceae bacterium]
MKTKRIIVIGGGAAGFFAAINCKLLNPAFEVKILEKTNKLLSKVLVSGGGRCNVTNHCFDNKQLVKNYPRGEKELMQVFSRFAVQDTINWFKEQNIELKVEADGRMFPASNKSETIANCFLDLAKKLSIEVIIQCEVQKINKEESFEMKTSKGNFEADVLICSMGGNNKIEGYKILKELGHNIISPIPSLFTINLPSENIKKELQGVAVQNATVTIEKTKFNYTGPILVTHWGLSGPAVLKLSAFAAPHFFETDYKNNILINWTGNLKLNEILEELNQQKINSARSIIIKTPLFQLPKRLWEFLLNKAGVLSETSWSNISKQQLNKLSETIYRDVYKMEGKTTFKEEFVTAGGIDLKEIDFKTMQSKLVKDLYFCGEVLNIDGITGGFNFQNAWSTAYVCASSI